MASIDIQHPHTMNPAHARQAVQEVADKLAERFGVEYRWNGDILDFTRSGLDGRAPGWGRATAGNWLPPPAVARWPPCAGASIPVS